MSDWKIQLLPHCTVHNCGYWLESPILISRNFCSNFPFFRLLQTVESHAFTGLKHVKFIFLPAGVRHLKPDAFSGLEMVDKLKLAYLDLNELASFTFRGIKKLRSLTIENSDLATIRSNAFSGTIFSVKLIQKLKSKQYFSIKKVQLS